MAIVTVRDLPTTADNPATAERFAAVVSRYLAFDPLVGKQLKALRSDDPELPMALCLNGIFQMMFGSAALTAKAQASHQQLLQLLDRVGGTAREHLHAEALGAWSRGQLDRALLAWEQILTDHPRDLLALRLAHHLHFYGGQPDRLAASVARVLPHWGEDHPDHGYVLGMHAFGLEEAGDYSAAEATGREALRLNPDDAWAIHAVAHVMEMTGRTADGVQWLKSTEANWGKANNFRFHIVWHQCLFHLEQQEYPAVLDLYDHQVASDLDSHFQLDLANAASLLARLQLHGVDVGSRWAALAKVSVDHVQDRELVFMGLHHLLALLAAGAHTPASELLANLRQWASDGSSQARVLEQAGLAVATGLAALTANKPAEARQALDMALPNLAAIGGSRAQRDLFHMLALHASRLTGDLEDFSFRLAERRSQRPVDSWPFEPA